MSGECDVCGAHCLDCRCGQNKIKALCAPSHLDPINPPHYHGKRMEAIDIIDDFGLNFCLGNAIKYILRAGKKGSRATDLAKAIWYLKRELDKRTM